MDAIMSANNANGYFVGMYKGSEAADLVILIQLHSSPHKGLYFSMYLIFIVNIVERVLSHLHLTCRRSH